MPVTAMIATGLTSRPLRGLGFGSPLESGADGALRAAMGVCRSCAAAFLSADANLASRRATNDSNSPPGYLASAAEWWTR